MSTPESVRLLDLILPDFKNSFWSQDREDTIAQVLRAENARVVDPRHIESMIVGPAEFDWDFRCLQSGFIDLVAPFMARQSGCSHLLLMALDEIGVNRPSTQHLIPIVEYAHYVSLVNDFYSLHPALNQGQPNRFAAAKLTQLKYASQFLAVYPKHIVLHNLLEIGLSTRNRFHREIMQCAVSEGSSRGVFLEWARRGLSGVTPAQYQQNAAFTMAGYFLGPVVLACLMADVPESDLMQVKRAFSWLGMAAKLELERRTLICAVAGPVQEERSSHFLILSFPGSYLLERQLPSSPSDTATGRSHHFPNYLGWQESARKHLLQQPVERHVCVDSMLDRFEQTMASTGILTDLTARLSRSLRKGGLSS